MCIDYWSYLSQSMSEGVKYETYKIVQPKPLVVQNK